MSVNIGEMILKALKEYWFNIYNVVAMSVASSHLISHASAVNIYKKIVSMYDDGEPAKLHPRLYILFKNVLEDLKVPQKDYETYDPFVFFGLDTYSMGVTFSKFGVKIGIPLTYAYNRAEDLNASKIYLSNETIDWTRPSAQILLKSLILPEEAKKFAVAREVVSTQSLDLMRKSLSYPFFVAAASMSYLHLYNKLNLAHKLWPARGLVYGVCALSSGLVWLAQDNYFAYWKEKKVNEKLVKLGPEYMKGGYEFYDKILQRNLAIRALMDEKSKDLFTDRGEQNSKYRYMFKKMLISDRRNFFAAKLRETMQEVSDVAPTLAG